MKIPSLLMLAVLTLITSQAFAKIKPEMSCFDSKGNEVPLYIQYDEFGDSIYTIGLITYSESQVRVQDNGEGAKALYLNGSKNANLLCIYYDGTRPTASEIAASTHRKDYVPLPRPRPRRMQYAPVPLPRPRPHLQQKTVYVPLPRPRPTRLTQIAKVVKVSKPATRIHVNSRIWGRSRHATEWTRAVIAVFRKRQRDFEQARDLNKFCPGYFRSSQSDREDCIVRLVAAVVKPESSFNPNAKFREPTGVWSVGLLALSPGECSNAPTLRSLENGAKNLTCGVNKMANLIREAHYISGPWYKRGAASYWSTLRTPYRYGRYRLGKIGQILAVTRGYSGNS